MADQEDTDIQLNINVKRFLFISVLVKPSYLLFTHGGLMYRLAGISSLKIILPSPQKGHLVGFSPVIKR